MNKIAIFSDIHSNIFALKEFIRVVQHEVDGIYCCGDILGYFPFQEEVVEIFKKHNIISIKGNHDKYITDELVPREPNAMLDKSIIYGKRVLTRKTRDYIRDLPDMLRFAVGKNEAVLCHGLFQDCETHICENDLSLYLNNENLNNKIADYNFFGHTHIPFIKSKSGKTFISAGSLGYPRAGEPNYLLFDVDNMSVKIMCLEYPKGKLRKEIELFDYDEGYKRMLLSKL